MTTKKLIIILSFCFGLAVVITILQCWIHNSTKAFIYSDINHLPNSDFAVVLGTSRYLQNGKSNPFYTERINGAAELYHQGKVKHFIVSGDNQYLNYNEPRMMAQDLIKKGVPRSAITYDFAGFRTLDSIIRANKVFELNHFTIVTQQFHCERAIFIAIKHQIQANCFSVKNPKHSFYTKFREFFARLDAISDIYLFKTQPRFLGKLEPISLKHKKNI